jgi:hypothetical protein
MIGSTQAARAVADQYGKQLIMVPGLRLMTENWDLYPEMAALADGWVIEAQRLQVNDPGSVYRGEVEKIVQQLLSGNLDIRIWIQITLPPDREPESERWLAYRQSISDLAEGTFVGVYTWDKFDTDVLVDTVDAIFDSACAGGQ